MEASKKILINSIKYLPMPYQKKSVVPLVRLSEALRILYKGILHPSEDKNIICYNIVSDSPPKVGEFLQDSFDEFGFKVQVVPLPKTRMNNVLMDKVGISKNLLSYLYSQCVYESQNVKRDFNFYQTPYRVFKKDLLIRVRDSL